MTNPRTCAECGQSLADDEDDVCNDCIDADEDEDEDEDEDNEEGEFEDE